MVPDHMVVSGGNKIETEAGWLQNHALIYHFILPHKSISLKTKRHISLHVSLVLD